MKALQINQYGNNDVVEFNVTIQKPIPTENQLLVKIYAAGLNPVDWKIREGFLKEFKPLDFPFTLGMDFSGVIESMGKNVSGFKPGDEVYGTSNVFSGGTGSFAEYLVVDKNAIAHKPSNISHAKAAAFPMGGVSAWQALMDYMKLKAEQKILIHGGAGGIGSIAIQMAKDLGLYVATTASQSNMAYVKSLDADEIIDYQKQAFHKILKNYDAVLDTVGGESYTNSYKILKKGGIIVSMLEQPSAELMEKYGVRAVIEFTEIDHKRLAELAALIDQHKIDINVGKIFKFDDAKLALDYQQNGRPQGKVVMTIFKGY